MTLSALAGSVEITPPVGTELAGFAGTRRRSTCVHSPLEANFVWLEGDSGSVLLITVDALYPGLIDQFVRQSLPPESTPDELIVAASHTHFSFATEPEIPGLGAIDLEFVEAIGARIAAAVCHALTHSSPAPCRLTVGLESVSHVTVGRRSQAWALRIADRRRPISQQVLRRPSPAIEATVRTLELTSLDGAPICMIWTMACHPSQFPITDSISAEFPGVARESFRATVGAVPVLFLQGFSGDQRPRLLSWWKGIYRSERVENILNRSPSFSGHVGMAEWNDWARLCADAALRARAGAIEIDVVDVKVKTSELALDRVYKGATTAPPITLRGLSFGPDLAMLTTGGEPMSDCPVRRDDPTVWRIGYCDRGFGYLPRFEDANDGSYEGGQFLDRMGLTWSLEADGLITHEQLLEQVSARIPPS